MIIRHCSFPIKQRAAAGSAAAGVFSFFLIFNFLVCLISGLVGRKGDALPGSI